VQAGDKHKNGSEVVSHAVNGDTIYFKSLATEWVPDNKKGGPQRPIPSDVYVEEWVFPVRASLAFAVRYRVTHFGTDTHTVASQELPCIYATSTLSFLATYSGNHPWSNDSLTVARLPLGRDGVTSYTYASEHWQSLVDSTGNGLTIFEPSQFPYTRGSHTDGDGGPMGRGFNYDRPFVPAAFGPRQEVDLTVYVIPGNYRDARAIVYSLHQVLPVPEGTHSLQAFGVMDSPRAEAVLNGIATVSGWAFDNDSVAKVTIQVDGVDAGAADYGTARPDVEKLFPRVSPAIGFRYRLDTRAFKNGEHVVDVVAQNAAGKSVVLPTVRVVFAN
jgi:hypothetical protein